jgi:hypothetical protein
MPAEAMRKGLVCAAVLLFLSSSVRAEPGWSFQVSVGEVANLETSLEIRQEGSPKIELDAGYETRPFEPPLYYALRAGRNGWELELIHQKIFLKNRPPEVQHFAVSHGYNLLTVNRAWDAKRLVWRIGAGAVIAHPENEVRGRELDPDDTNLGGGYHLTGPVFQAGVEKRIELGERWLFGIEGKASAARAVIPVAGGEADVPNAALHLLFGVGWRTGGAL